MKGYDLPPNLDEDIRKLEELIAKYRKGEIQATELKVHRVPFGVYEQREPDTYMMRIRCAAGVITPPQLEKVAAIAGEYGISDIHLTSRQELQLHYVKLDDIVAIIRRLKEVGLVTRGGGGNTVRNISAQEDAGIDPKEEFDVTPYALSLTTRLIAESDSWNLPRKFKIAFSGSAEDKGYATITDVGFIAKLKESKKGFKVYAAGGLGAKSEVGKFLLDFIGADEVYPVAKALKNIFFKYGNRKNRHAARLRFLWNDLGDVEFKKRFDEEYAKVKQEGLAPLAIEEPKNTTAIPVLSEETPRDTRAFDLWKKRYVGAQKQKGLFSATIPIELGFISRQTCAKLALFSTAFGDDALRMTKDQNFLLRNIPQQNLGNVYNFLAANFKDSDRPAIYGRILSCAGASTCQLGICLSRPAARAIMKELEKSALDLDRSGDIKLNISGCPNSCGQHPAADLGFFGKAGRKTIQPSVGNIPRPLAEGKEGHLYPAYNVVCGAVIKDGKAKLAEQVGEVAAKDMPRLVKDIFATYLASAGGHTSFRDYITSEGKERLKKLCERYKDIPDFGEDKNYYFDWGSDKLFSLAERRAGECSAGIFDLIEMDLKNIKETRRKLGGVQAKPGREELLADLVFYSSRALLITRGVEPENRRQAYEAFLRHFVETGLVETSFKEIIAAAERKDYQTVLNKEKEVEALAEAVESLYENMDNAFNFSKASSNCHCERPEGAKQSQKGVASALSAPRNDVVLKDLRGVACPMNFVKTKIELSRLKPGERLEVLLDDGEPIENVPGSVRQEGHRIIEEKKIDNYWSVTIEKK